MSQRSQVPASAQESESQPPRNRSQTESLSLEPSPTLDRSIDLAPQDWFRALGKSQALPRPQPQLFDRQAALTQLSKVKIQWGWNWQWGKVPIATVLTREEAHFWLTAILRVNRHIAEHTQLGQSQPFEYLTPQELVAELAGQIFDGQISESEIYKALLSMTSYSIAPEIAIPLVNLIRPESLIRLLLEVQKRVPNSVYINGNSSENLDVLSFQYLNPAMFFLNQALLQGVSQHLLPYLSHEQIETLQQLVRSHLDPSQWMAQDLAVVEHYNLAVLLKMHPEIQTLVEQIPDSIAKPLHYRLNILLGLGDRDLMITQARRFNLLLRDPDQVRCWLACTEYAALDIVRDSILAIQNKADAEAMLQVLALVKAPETAPLMLELMIDSKAPAVARQWLLTYSDYAIAGLLPIAARRGRLATAAIDFLRELQRKGYTDSIQYWMQKESAAIAAVIQTAVLDYKEPGENHPVFDQQTTPSWLTEAIDRLHLKPRDYPTWVTPSDLPPIVVGKFQLSSSQVQALFAALKKSDLDNPAELIIQLRQQGTAQSLDAFAWRLFEFWLSQGAVAKEKWAMLAVGLLGGDRSAANLAALIRMMPGAGQHARAVLGLECLRVIATDVALIQINAIAQTVKYKSLKTKASECMALIARDRNLTRDQLEDRIVPTLDLNEKGVRSFDFGSRRFTSHIDKRFKPVLMDEAGKLRSDLPKPSGKDDADLAAGAIAAWKLFKKQLKESVALQVARLEQAMITNRRWSREEFETLLMQHPLMLYFVQALLWNGYDLSGTLIKTFRVTPEHVFQDVNDRPFETGSIQQIGITHALHLSQEQRSAWKGIFKGNDIHSPFVQIDRLTYSLQSDELTSTAITRFKNQPVSPLVFIGRVDKLQWMRGVPLDGGFYAENCKPFPQANVTAVIEHSGLAIGYSGDWHWDDVVIERCIFVPGIYTPIGYPEHEYLLPLNMVDPIVVSEVLSDLHRIVEKA